MKKSTIRNKAALYSALGIMLFQNALPLTNVYAQAEPVVTDTDSTTQLSTSYTAQYAADAEFTYVINDNQATITEIKSVPPDWDGHLVIPNTIEDNGNIYPVVAIGKKAFFERADINAVIFEPNDNLASIGEEAFMRTPIAALDLSGCTALTDIGSRAFESTSRLVDVTFPAKLKNLGERVFWESGIRVADLSECSDLETIKQQTFEYAQQLHTVKLPPKLTSIENKAFKGTNLQAIDFSNTPKLTTIGTEALALKDNAALSEILTGANFQQICDALTANKDTGVKTDVVIKGHADISMNLDGSDYTATQSTEISVQDLYDNEKPTYGNVVFSDELNQAIATLPTGSTIVWKDAQDEEVDLTTAGEHIGPFTGTVIGVNRNLEVSGDDITEGTDYRFNDVDKTLTITSNQPMTIKNADLTAASDYRIIIPVGVTAELTFNGIYVDVDSDRDAGGAFSVEAGGKASVTLAEGTVNTLKNTSGTNNQRGYGISNRDNFAADSLILKGTGTLKASGGMAGYDGSGTIESGNYEFTSLTTGIVQNSQTAMEIQGGRVLAKGDRAEGVSQALVNKNGLHVSDGFLRVETSKQDDGLAIHRGRITGGTVEVANTSDGNAAVFTTITGGSVKVLQGTTEFLAPTNAQFMQKIAHAIPAEGSEVTITDLSTTNPIDPANFNLPTNHSDNNDLSFYLVKAKDYEVKIKDQDNIGQIMKYGLTWNTAITDWEVKEIVDSSALQAMIDEAKALTEADYTPSSWAVLKPALAAAETAATSADATQAQINDAQRDLRMAIDDLKKYYTVTFDSQGGSKIDPEKVEEGSRATKPSDPTKIGYTLAGWYKDEQFKDAFDFNSDTIKGDTILYAKWTANNYKIQFNANGGSGMMADQAMVFDESKALTPNSFFRNGYIFKSWNTQPDGNGNSYVDSTSVLNLSPIDGSVVKLYAQWEETIDKTGLQAAVDQAEALNKADYTTGSWTNSDIEAVLAEARRILGEENATQKQINDAKNALEDAIESLVPLAISEADQEAIKAALNTPEESIYDGEIREATFDQDKLPTAYKGKLTIIYKQGNTESATEPKNVGEYKVIIQVQDRDSFDSGKTIKINQKALTVTDVKGKDRQVNNSLRVELSGGSLVGVVKNEEIGFELGTGIIANEAAKTTAGTYDVTTNIQLTGTGIGNYTLTQPTDITVTLISKVDLWILYDEEDSKGRAAAEYTAASWKAYEEAMTEAERVLNNDDATQKETDDAQKALEDAVAGLEYQAKADLNEKIKDAEALDQNDYTSDSWNHLQEALEEAKHVANDPNSTPTELKDAEDNLQNAIEDLVEKGDTAQLQELVEETGNLQENQYTPDTWANLAEAKKEAEDLIATGDASKQEVKEAETKLQHALDDLQNRADFSALQKLYDEEITTDRDENQYTRASWSAYDDAMKAAETVLANLNATQQQVDDAKTALETAVAGLQKLGDKTDLNQLIKEMEALKEADFTKDSWTALQNALSAAKKIAANDQATEKEVAKAQEELGTAKNNLVNIKDLRDLSNKTFEEDLYTKASWNAYDKAHEAAKTVLANPAASQKAVDDAQTALQNTIDSLVYKAKTDLDELIKDAEALDQDDYTSASWGDLKEVLEAAKTTANDPAATPEELQEAEDNLQNAIDDLVEKGDTSDLQTIVDEANKLKEEDFTPESWKNLTDARDDAQGLIDSGDASKQAVKEAEDKLRSALDGLKKKADYSALQKLYDAEIKAQRNEKDYTKASWGVYDKAIKAAEQMLKNPNATQKQVDAAEDELKTAVAGLQKLWDRTDLQNLIAELEKLKEKDYTKDSWTALQNALSAAKKVAANDQATDNEVAKAQEALGKGKNQLVNLKELKDLYENETGKRRDDQLYTADTWKAYQKALDNASEILVKDNAKQKQVDDAQTALTKAVKNLETKKHAVLDQLVKDEQEKNRQEKDYTADSWKIYENALKQAEQVLMDHDATDDEITTAMKNLQSAISGLKKATRQGSGGNPSSGSTTKTYPTTSRTTTPSTTKSTSGSLPKTGMITTGLPMGLGAGIIAAVSAIFKRRRNKK